MKYDGLIGKVANAIPNSSAKKFAAIGAGVVAPIGAGLSYYENQDVGDAALGGLRSAAFGGILGVATHKMPSMISANTTGKGLKQLLTNEDVLEYGSSFVNTLKPFRDSLKNDVDYFKNPSNVSAYEQALGNFSSSPLHQKVIDSTENNMQAFIGMKDDKLQMAKTYASGVTQAGFNSVYSHIVKPTGQFLRGNMTLETTAATAFSAYGLYEAGSAINNVRQGEYSQAISTVGALAISKGLYAGVVGSAKALHLAHKSGASPIDLYYGAKYTKHGLDADLLGGQKNGLGFLASTYTASAQSKAIRNFYKNTGT